MPDYALIIEDETTGTYTASEVADRLQQYREEHPEDHEFSNVRILEMTGRSSNAGERPVWDFIEREERCTKTWQGKRCRLPARHYGPCQFIL